MRVVSMRETPSNAIYDRRNRISAQTPESAAIRSCYQRCLQQIHGLLARESFVIVAVLLIDHSTSTTRVANTGRTASIVDLTAVARRE